MSQRVCRQARWLAPALLLFAGSAHAQVKEPAELLPAETLAYVELRQPERLARELAALTKGSALDNLPQTMAKFRARQPEGDYPSWRTENVAMFSTFLAPEVIAEAGRLQGAVLALTGIGKDGPQYVAVILSGSSNIPTFALRTALASDWEMRDRGEVEGITLYRARRRNWRKKAFREDVPQGPAFEENGPTFALLPGGVVLGAEDSVKEVIRRARGKAGTPSLTSVRAYKDSARLRQQPGLFAYADLAALSGQLDQLYKNDTSSDARTWSAIKSVVKPEAFRSAALSLSLAGGELALQAHVQVDPKSSSPVLDLLPQGPADTALLRLVPRGTTLGLCMSLRDGAARWQKFLDLMDAAVRSQGVRRGELLPSQGVAELESRLKLKLGKDVFGKLDGVGVVYDLAEALSGKAQRLPVLVLGGKDEEAARYLEEKVVPKVLAALVKPLHCVRKGKVVVLGEGRQSLAAVGRGEGVLADRRVAAAVKALDSPLLVGVVPVGQTLVPVLRELETMNLSEYERRFGKEKRFEPPTPRTRPAPFEKYVKELEKIVAPMTPAVVSLARKPDRLTLEVRQPGLRTYTAPVINLWIESALERGARQEQEYRRRREREREQFRKEKPADRPVKEKGFRKD